MYKIKIMINVFKLNGNEVKFLTDYEMDWFYWNSEINILNEKWCVDAMDIFKLLVKYK